LLRAEAVAWLDAAYGRSSEVHIGPTGPAIVGLLAGLVGLALSLVRLLPQAAVPERCLGPGRLALILALPALAAPPLAILLDPGLLPVLVADHLALHLALYGALQLGLLALWRVPFGRLSPGALAFLLVAFTVLCLALDRYAANFWPTPGRGAIIAALAGGALLFFVADARLVHGRGVLGRALIRLAFLASLGLAVALDFEGLFFLMMIAPVVVLFYIVFGTLGHAVARRAGPVAPGIALGLVLAYARGVSFPLFAG